MEEIRDKVINILQDIVKHLTFADAGDYARSLGDLGVDSLDTMSIFLAVEENFGLDEIPEDKITELTTVNLITSYIKGELEKKGSTEIN